MCLPRTAEVVTSKEQKWTVGDQSSHGRPRQGAGTKPQARGVRQVRAAGAAALTQAECLEAKAVGG